MQLSGHALHRSHQRSVPPHIVSAIYDYGSASQSRGLTALTLDRQAIALARSELSPAGVFNLDRYAGCYLIIGENEKIVTVARRTRRFRR